MSLFPVAIITLFWKHEIGLTMTEIMLLQGYFGLCVACFEFPSGYFADRFGYRKTLLLASVLVMVGWSLYCVSATVAAILVAETVLALGMSLISGTDQAIMFESLKNTPFHLAKCRQLEAAAPAVNAVIQAVHFALNPAIVPLDLMR